MAELIAALDIGGTKTQLIIEEVRGKRLLDVTEPSLDWEAEPAHEAAEFIAARVSKHTPPGGKVVALAFGAQGIDRPETAHALEAALAAKGYPATAVNDAWLLIAAGGFTQGIGVISGTGAIAVGADSSGTFVAAGGWGWVLGDDGGASALVREATKAALYARDDGKPDDGLLGALVRDYGVADAERLTRLVNDEPTMDNWAPHAPAVFAAADAGSALAIRVIDDGARALADNVRQIRSRGAVGTDVVVAGSVFVNQSRLLEAFTRHLAALAPGLRVHRLEKAPVEGAVFLARNAAAARRT
jgi:N-acetylglucosamine kinase-like BadF-type ATPase